MKTLIVIAIAVIIIVVGIICAMLILGDENITSPFDGVSNTDERTMDEDFESDEKESSLNSP
ncbi:MAG: hypothetical protein CK527_00570 [Nitrosarchaeum sp.]|nr:MAG: hypothetical protein CK527_00570 [Nitrosarchaeum sp.]